MGEEEYKIIPRKGTSVSQNAGRALVHGDIRARHVSVLWRDPDVHAKR